MDKNFKILQKSLKYAINQFNKEIKIQEIQAFSNYLGVDLQNEPKYLYMIKNRLKADLRGWDIHYTQKGEKFYRNIDNKEFRWQNPLDLKYR